MPIGDKLLFSNYDYCLNLGGFSNISFDHDGQRLAFDVGPVNTVLNHLASRLGFEYDHNGELAKTGKMLPELLQQLNELPYYKSLPPKSLGIEWVQEQIFPVLVSEKRLIFCILFVITLLIKSFWQSI